MRRTLQVIYLAVLCAMASSWAVAADPNISDASLESVPTAKAVVIPCKGLIDQALFESIKRRSETAMAAGADYLVYEIGTYGGLVDAADSIAKYFIQTVGDRARTVAYVTTEAISAGALVSVSCNDIVMRKSTTIGDCAPITLGGKLEGVEREKAESFIRAAFQRAAEANGYPELPLKAMVTMQIEVWRVTNLQSGHWELFEGKTLPTDANEYDVEGAEEIVGPDELLTLTASQALEYGVARAVVDDLDGTLAFLERRDGVVFPEAPIVLDTTWSERMVSWLNSPAVMGVLIMLALLGVYIELSAPGVGLPGLVAVICFALIIGSKYLTGLANWIEIILLFAGIALLLIEFLVLPGFGIAGVLGIIFVFAGLFGMLIGNAPDQLPWPETPQDWSTLTDGLLGMAFGFVGFLVLAALFARFLPRLRFMSGLILVPAAGQGSSVLSITAPSESKQTGVRVGDIGRVTSRLRPAGRARFGDAIVDVVATAEFLDVGTSIEIIEIHGNRVVVRSVENA